jgi:hypothetical protein
MKISTETIQVLKNFAMINPNMVFLPGKTLATLNVAKSIFARVEIEEEIPRKFGIYELNSLLQILTFSEDQEIDFGESNITVTNDMGSFEYFYCSVNLPEAPTKNIVLKPFFQFDLSSKDIQTITKVMALLAAPTLSIVSKKGKVSLKIGDKKNATANSFNRDIGKCEDDFQCDLATENFKMMPNDYKVTIAKEPSMACEFKSTAGKQMVYILAVEPTSKI